jgi:hypothetical protein
MAPAWRPAVLAALGLTSLLLLHAALALRVATPRSAAGRSLLSDPDPTEWQPAPPPEDTNATDIPTLFPTEEPTPAPVATDAPTLAPNATDTPTPTPDANATCPPEDGWPETPANTTACILSISTVFVSRVCYENGTWAEAEQNGCSLAVAPLVRRFHSLFIALGICTVLALLILACAGRYCYRRCVRRRSDPFSSVYPKRVPLATAVEDAEEVPMTTMTLGQKALSTLNTGARTVKAAVTKSRRPTSYNKLKSGMPEEDWADDDQQTKLLAELDRAPLPRPDARLSPAAVRSLARLPPVSEDLQLDDDAPMGPL